MKRLGVIAAYQVLIFAAVVGILLWSDRPANGQANQSHPVSEIYPPAWQFELAPQANNCYSTTYDPNKLYRIGDTVWTLDACVIDGDGCWISIVNDNKGRDPHKPENQQWNWHRSCGIVGPEPMGELIDEYVKLRHENDRLKAQLSLTIHRTWPEVHISKESQ